MIPSAIVRVGAEEFQRLTEADQQAFKGWVKSFFDCNPDHIEWAEFSLDPTTVNSSMMINLLILENSKRPTLISELHVARITTLAPKGLLTRLAKVAGVC